MKQTKKKLPQFLTDFDFADIATAEKSIDWGEDESVKIIKASGK